MGPAARARLQTPSTIAAGDTPPHHGATRAASSMALQLATVVPSRAFEPRRLLAASPAVAAAARRQHLHKQSLLLKNSADGAEAEVMRPPTGDRLDRMARPKHAFMEDRGAVFHRHEEGVLCADGVHSHGTVVDIVDRLHRQAVFQREARTKRLDQKFLAELTPHKKYDAEEMEDAVHRLYNGPVEKREGRRRREDERLSEFDAHVIRYQKIAQAVRRGRAQQGVAGGEPLPLEGKAAAFVERMYDGALEKRRARHDKMNRRYVAPTEIRGKRVSKAVIAASVVRLSPVPQ
jgi:hypothetical protein